MHSMEHSLTFMKVALLEAHVSFKNSININSIKCAHINLNVLWYNTKYLQSSLHVYIKLF